MIPKKEKDQNLTVSNPFIPKETLQSLQMRGVLYKHVLQLVKDVCFSHIQDPKAIIWGFQCFFFDPYLSYDDFHGLIYKQFITEFCMIMTFIIDSMIKREFHWNKVRFGEIECKKAKSPVLSHSIFSKVFEATCDASSVGIAGILSQESCPIAYFSEKLNEVSKDIPLMMKGSILLCEHLVIRGIIYYLKRLCYTLTINH